MRLIQIIKPTPMKPLNIFIIVGRFNINIHSFLAAVLGLKAFSPREANPRI